MKHYLIRCSLVLSLLLTLSLQSAFAQQSYSSLYISISDALINTKQDNDTKVQKALEQFASDWALVETKETEQQQKVTAAFDAAMSSATKEQRLQALSTLSNELRALEKLENPVDEAAQRKEFEQKFTPVMQQFELALASKDLTQINEAYTEFNVKWNKNERPIREQSVAMYGQIETQMAFLRITLASENPDMATIQAQYDSLKQTITDFIAGKETAEVVEGDYSLQSLINYIDEASDFIEKQQFDEAAGQITEFITIWPSVEMEISTRNGSLYTKIESTMPLLVSELMKATPDTKKVTKQLEQFKTEIQLVQENSDYSFWDSALILLREGLEALLIIMALVAFLEKSGQPHMRKWIYVGAGSGILVSAITAILMLTLFNSATVNTNRELLEGCIGLIAAAMMIGVGIWLHNKSSVTSWNAYIAKQMNHAISKQSVFAMAFISFLSVFREGAETLLFYAGIAPKMELSQFVLGIVVALVILIVFAIVLFKVSGKIPVHKFFAVATVLIYVLAFKIIGVSIHTLQLTSKISTTVIDGLPVISTIGFYPTIETVLGQTVLIVLVIGTVILKKRK
ncbi:FTR1 family iron permease [Solibacillus daqui]|uniref:FTR1 family iron permease n=1 Tax=Solibacillus daqui TaxID=2912187 RepID=UPI0023654646|nr:FTR1 family protein [Solibacillus daqui]